MNRFTGMRGFWVIWVGQMASLIGTAMTKFGLLIWLWNETGKATTISLYLFITYMLYLVLSPFGGQVVDKLNRRQILVVSDMIAAIGTLTLLILVRTDNLSIGAIIGVQFFVGGMDAFQVPASKAAMSMLVPKEHYGRTNGLMSFAYHASRIGGPAFAAVLLPVISLQGIMMIDIATFVLSMVLLTLVFIPQPARSADGEAAEGSTLHQMSFAWRYIRQRPGLFALLVMFTIINGLAGLTYFSTLTPMVLARATTMEPSAALATVEALMGVGGVVGAILMSAWGGGKHRVRVILLFMVSSFLLGDLLFAVGRDVPAWALAGFLAAVFIPVIVGNNLAIWQAKVAPDVQGRVFSIYYTITELLLPVGLLIGGPIADNIMEPAMRHPNGISWLIGSGPGTGVAAMFLFTGIMGATVAALSFFSKPMMNVERDLPDHDEVEVHVTEAVPAPAK